MDLVTTLITAVIWIAVITNIVQAVKKGKNGEGEKKSAPVKNAAPIRQVKPAPVKPSVPMRQEKPDTESSVEMSTTDYLEEKARQDEIEHEREREAEERNNSSAGLRLNDGDMLLPGMQAVRCPYCGADNMIPQNERRAYTCYFCREEL